jgi:adenylylsulfate kinase
VTRIPNISHVFYGRDVGYTVERIDLEASVEAISATEYRRRAQPPAAAPAET